MANVVLSSGAASTPNKAPGNILSLGPSLKRIGEEVKAKMEREALDPAICAAKDILARNPLPEDLDPFTRTLLGGVDEVAAHQALTLVLPILAFLGQNARVIYNDDTLRWISGQSWQMGGSGCGKSLVLRKLEELFLARELRQNIENAKVASDYSLLSEKEKKETPVPDVELHILDSIPTALALLQQMQINKGGAIYISCSECGEFGKKIGNPYYSLVLDMLKKSYDGVGEPFMHKNKEAIYYTPSMKLCCNIGGTIDPMFKIFRHCNADGTLSRSNLTILPERKDEKVDGKYKSPSWTMEEKQLLWEAADRLRNTNNTFKENEKIISDPECGALLEKFGYRMAEGMPPSVEQLESAVAQERLERAFSVAEVQQLGLDIKCYLAGLGDVAADCCSRADERAMGLCYLLLIANGFRFEHHSANADSADRADNSSAGDDARLVRQVVEVVRWWVMMTIDCALAVQNRIDLKIRSEKRGVMNAYGEIRHVSSEIQEARNFAFADYEERNRGQTLSIDGLREYAVFANLHFSTLYRLTVERGWKSIRRGAYRLPDKEEEAAT